MKPKAAISWSGGKDSCAALMRAHLDFDVITMVTMVDESAKRSRSHGLRPELLDAQAERLGMRRLIGRCSWATYDQEYGAVLEKLNADGITHVIFGDIVFPAHKEWAEGMCAGRGLTAVEPLFGAPTDQLFVDWIDSGSSALIVTARAEHLDATWVGRSLSREMLGAFQRLGVDPCGERGEYHTLVTDCPLFDSPLNVNYGEVVLRSGCWALDVAIA